MKHKTGEAVYCRFYLTALATQFTEISSVLAIENGTSGKIIFDKQNNALSLWAHTVNCLCIVLTL